MPAHPSGRGWPFASVATGSGLLDVGTGVLDEDVDVHAVAAQSAVMVRIANRRMVPSRRYTIGRRVGAGRGRYSAAMTSSGMSKFA